MDAIGVGAIEPIGRKLVTNGELVEQASSFIIWDVTRRTADEMTLKKLLSLVASINNQLMPKNKTRNFENVLQNNCCINVLLYI